MRDKKPECHLLLLKREKGVFDTDKFLLFFPLFFIPEAREVVSKLFPAELQKAEKWS